jgi:phosphatidyl-myo-inositol dimannoside synthase
LTVGRMDSTERYKGHDRVIAALPEFVSQGHDVYYLIVGEGDDRPRLEAMAVEAGVQQRVLFLGGVDSQTLSAIYRCADLFVMASTGEGFGVAFLEAMASGTPAIGLDVGGAPDALGDGELGLVVREDEITEVIATLLTGNKVDRSTLASTVHSRFGRGKFKAAACSALSRLFAAA